MSLLSALLQVEASWPSTKALNPLAVMFAMIRRNLVPIHDNDHPYLNDEVRLVYGELAQLTMATNLGTLWFFIIASHLPSSLLVGDLVFGARHEVMWANVMWDPRRTHTHASTSLRSILATYGKTLDKVSGRKRVRYMMKTRFFVFKISISFTSLTSFRSGL